VQPELSAAVHDGDGMRPFTVSSLCGTGQPRNGLVTLRPQHTYTLRVTTLHADLTRLVRSALLGTWLSQGIRLHDQPLHVEGVEAERGLLDYAELYRKHTTPARLISRQTTFHFVSPTAFKKTGGLIVPLPQPDLVFGSLADRWTRFSGIALPEGLRDKLVGSIEVLSQRTETRHVSFERSGRGEVTGFVGEATYRVVGDDRMLIAWFRLLAAFAPYSGVGLRTTVGLGQVEVGGRE
jgi:CRISPR-associated endoribonuclease Cas6